MRPRTIGTLIGAGALVGLAAVAIKQSNLYEAFETQLFINQQLRHEYPGLVTPNKRQLDPTPFQQALTMLGAERLRAIDALIAGQSISHLQRLLSNGQLTAEELTLHYIDRILRFNPDLNAVIELNPDALEIARQSDLSRQAGAPYGPLTGIPVLIKDNIATGDRMHTSAGARALAEAGSDRDAFIVDRLRRAGAIILGKNNMSEWAYYMSSKGICGYSAIGGQTHNPHGPFEVGGSSSGSAVAVAAGLCAAAVGSETNGSLIYPASQNGIVSLKPSLGLVSRDRIIPITDSQDTAGPMARSVADAAILMEALVGSDPNDPITDASRTISRNFSPSSHGLRGVRVGLIRKVLRPGDSYAYQTAIAALRMAGADVREIPAPEVKFADTLAYGFQIGLKSYFEAVRGYTPVESLAEVIAFNRTNLREHAPYGQDILEKALATRSTDQEYHDNIQRNRKIGAKAIRKALAEHRIDLMITLSNYDSSLYACPGFPAITLPLQRRASGEPVGITFIGDQFADQTLFSAAAALEEALRIL